MSEDHSLTGRHKDVFQKWKVPQLDSANPVLSEAVAEFSSVEFDKGDQTAKIDILKKRTVTRFGCTFFGEILS